MQRFNSLCRVVSLVRPLFHSARFSTDANVTVAWHGPPKILSAPMREPDFRFGTYEIIRRMSTIDANPAGNIHGGTLMQMMEQAGAIVTTRHCNKHSPQAPGELAIQSVLVRLGHVDFWKPAFQNDVVSVQAKLIYASKHSMLVLMHVWAENVYGGGRRLTNRAFAWYVPVVGGVEGELGEVPPKVPKDDLEKDLYAFGEDSYLRLKKTNRKEVFFSSADPAIQTERIRMMSEEHIPPCPPLPVALPSNWPIENAKTIEETKGNVSTLVLPSDCRYRRNVATGGMVLKLMDEAAGICAFRHCHTNVVTAAVDALDFFSPVRVGNLVQAESRVVFASAKSMEIQVRVTVEDFFARTKQLANISNFHFVSLSNDGKPLEVPPIKIQNESEWLNFHEAKQRYEVIKAMREAATVRQAQNIKV